jgi:hypothetical protein
MYPSNTVIIFLFKLLLAAAISKQLPYLQVLFATAFYQSLSRLVQFVMTQIAKLKIVRKKG